MPVHGVNMPCAAKTAVSCRAIICFKLILKKYPTLRRNISLFPLKTYPILSSFRVVVSNITMVISVPSFRSPIHMTLMFHLRLLGVGQSSL